MDTEKLTTAIVSLAQAIDRLAGQLAPVPAAAFPSSNDSTPSACQVTPESPDPTAAFLAALWDAAPKTARERSSRKQIADAWRAIPAVHRPTFQRAIAALHEWRRSDSWRTDNGAYIEGLHRWIKNRRWEDTPATTRPAAAPSPTIHLPQEFLAWHASCAWSSIAPTVAWNTPRCRADFELRQSEL